MHSESKTIVSMPSDREIMLTRTFDAPRELVWKVWTDARHLAKWWGPVGFSTTTHRMDFRPGGQWRYVMHGPDGRDYENLITYGEIVEPERMTYKHGGEADTEPVNFTVTTTFEKTGPDGKGTIVTMRSLFPSKNARDFVIREYNAAEGGKQTLARLSEYVESIRASGTTSGPGAPFEIRRVFNAPRDLVWRAWTQREQLEQWFGPKEAKVTKSTLSFKIGGQFHYFMGSGEAGHWGKWIFREITPPERLVFTVSFADESGKAIRAPFDEKWPLEMLSTVEFHEHAGIGKGTVVTLRWEALSADVEEQRVFDNGHESMKQGWGGTFDGLEEYLARR